MATSYTTVVADCYQIEAMATAEETRRQNLLSLRARYGTLANLNRALGRDARDGTLSQIINQAPHTQSGRPRYMGAKLARHIEQRLGLTAGWMDGNHLAADARAGATASADLSTLPALTRPGEVDPQARPVSLAPGEMWLPRYEGVRAMMGDGSDGATGEVVTLLRVSVEGLRRRLARTAYSSLGNLKLLSAYGDSMAGTFDDGDVLLVDAGVTEVDRDGVYVYSRDEQLQVKRLQREDDGGLTAISDNPRYRDRRIERDTREQYRVHGRVLLAWTARVL